MRVAFGSVLDRPWGLTLGTIGMRKLTAQITITADDGKTYAIGFVDGRVTTAASPLPNDSIARVALTSHFISPVLVAEITSALAAEPDRDEVDVITERSRLSPAQAAALRARLVIQRAARTFSIDRGDFEIEDRVSLPLVAGFEVSLGAVIFQGVRMNLSDQRLADDLRELGTSFELRSTVTDDDIARFELGPEAIHVIESLRPGVTLAHLEATHRDLEPRTLHAMLYALVCESACDATGGQPVDRTEPATPRTSTGIVEETGRTATIRTDHVLVARTRTTRTTNAPPTGRPPTGAPPMDPRPRSITSGETVRARSASQTSPPVVGRSPTPAFPPPFGEQGTGSGTKPGFPRTPRTVTQRERAAREIEALIASRIEKLEQGADYFAILGVALEAPPETVRAAYFDTSHKLHPDSLSQVDLADADKAAQRVMAQVNAAFQTLSDPQRRRDYLQALQRGEPTPLAPRARTGDLDQNELAAEAFQRGEVALRRDDIETAVEELGRALILVPSNLEYLTLFAWAQFCAASDKAAAYVETRRALEKAINRSHKAVTARFYLGRVERMLGHDREAWRHFQDLLLDDPNHKEAAAEVRFLEAKLSRSGVKR